MSDDQEFDLPSEVEVSDGKVIMKVAGSVSANGTPEYGFHPGAVTLADIAEFVLIKDG
jgi:hypothetical protein